MVQTRFIAQQCPERTIISFREVAHGKSSVEVGRIFLSCLQLTNQGDLDILLGESPVGLMAANDFCISLKPAGVVDRGLWEQNANKTFSRNKKRDPHRKVHFKQEPIAEQRSSDVGLML